MATLAPCPEPLDLGGKRTCIPMLLVKPQDPSTVPAKDPEHRVSGAFLRETPLSSA